MATYFSPHYARESTATVAPATSIGGVHRVAAPGLAGGHIHEKRARPDFTNNTNTVDIDDDVVRMLTLKSNDRLTDLWISGDWNVSGGTLTWDVGLYHTGDANDGAVIDRTLFTSARNSGPLADRVDAFVESGTCEHTDRGKMMWQIAVIGGESYTIDPQLLFDVCITFNWAADPTSYGPVQIEARYVPGGSS